MPTGVGKRLSTLQEMPGQEALIVLTMKDGREVASRVEALPPDPRLPGR